jgi:Pentatricopeptide repeat domain
MFREKMLTSCSFFLLYVYIFCRANQYSYSSSSFVQEQVQKEQERQQTQKKLNRVLVNYVDNSDNPDYERKELLKEIAVRAQQGHWKAATRKLKRLSRRFPETIPSQDLLESVLEACMDSRLQGARASEPARKIMEQMMEYGYEISPSAVNYCIQNSLGDDSHTHKSTHQGHGGIDCAWAMLNVAHASEEKSATSMSAPVLSPETYDKICVGLARESHVVGAKALEQALTMLRSMVVNMAYTPPLNTFAAVANAAIQPANKGQIEKVLTVLTYAKAAGYELDKIGSIPEGRDLLASGVIAAQQMDNVALGLRFLTAASRVMDNNRRADVAVAAHSKEARRAATALHKDAIIKAVDSSSGSSDYEKQQAGWQLAVRLLTLMLERKLKPSPWVWRTVVTCCAKAEKSRKATGLLMDWVSLSEQGKINKPPLSVFNTVVNVCEICDEKELTLQVLDSMKATHDTEGNIITFNIALKRLAKLGNCNACEGIIIGMLKEEIEPSVVSYTTAIASCVGEEKNPALAYEWLRRMRSRRINPNVLTYNTALAACVDGGMESIGLASKMATKFLADADHQICANEDAVKAGVTKAGQYTNVIPDATSKRLARKLLEQLDAGVASGAMDSRVADETLRVSLKALADFNLVDRQCELVPEIPDDNKKKIVLPTTSRDEIELEYASHRIAEV